MEYSDRALNTHTGCLNGPDVCAVFDDCWARSMAKRLAGRYGYDKDHPFFPTVHYERMALPAKWRKPTRIHLNFMGDVCSWDLAYGPGWVYKDGDVLLSVHSAIAALVNIFDMCQLAPQHRFYFLTKRPDVIDRWCRVNGAVPDNVWVGTSISRRKDLLRVQQLAKVPAACKWISIEPMLEDVAPGLDLEGIQWVVLGARTGRHPFQPEMRWVADVGVLCTFHDVPLFVKDNIKESIGGRYYTIQQFPAIGPATWED